DLQCDGLGATSEFDPDLIVPNPVLSLREGAVAVWANRSSVHFAEFLDALTTHYRADIYTPYRDLPERFKEALLFGSGDDQIRFYFEKNDRRFTYHRAFEGIIPNLLRRYKETDSSFARRDIKQYMNSKACPQCLGTKLNPASRSVKVGSLTISQITALPIGRICEYFRNLKLSAKNAAIAERILRELTQRLGFLVNVGLPYLTLDRSANTLSGGESQRIRLATQIGSKLTGVLYVLDEPSIGLHQRDNLQLLSALAKMRDLGNTVVVVAHDEETIRRADYVVDMGPGAGIAGGEIVFCGSPEALMLSEISLTGRYLSGKASIDVPKYRRKGNGSGICIQGATQNNLNNIDVRFPLGCLICVTGVSGSGKSSLVLQTLYRAIKQRLHHKTISAGKYSDLT
ncbi:MAG: excinuclease ABC subunit UvrA, partial [Proteobacteria bacterium]|nr:excinuclease ABC subunit UvrA [Pseudomonadota bacterium]